jgi:hypothetical protein
MGDPVAALADMFEVDLFPDAAEGEAVAAPSPRAPRGSRASRLINILLEIWMNISRSTNNIYYVMHKFYLRVLFPYVIVFFSCL